MNTQWLETFSDQTRIWVYQSNVDFNDAQLARIQELGAHFTSQWSTHGTPLRAQVQVVDKRFVVVASDQSVTANSGCSMDKLTHFVQELGREFNVDFFDRMRVNLWIDNRWQAVDYRELASLAAQRTLQADTLVADPLIDNKTAFIHHFIKPIQDSWHYKAIESQFINRS
ncbi:MAG TPA: hypothetical protein VFV37_04535 [Luteibaculaceae bacterium]|nr:hypothetical protein [Luteibaculaceae bacterium]